MHNVGYCHWSTSFFHNNISECSVMSTCEINHNNISEWSVMSTCEINHNNISEWSVTSTRELLYQ